MADFCAECSVDTFGFDTKDLAGMTTPEHTQRGEFMAALCEDCGTTILVDHEGVRMTEIEPDIQIIDGEEKFIGGFANALKAGKVKQTFYIPTASSVPVLPAMANPGLTIDVQPEITAEVVE